MCFISYSNGDRYEGDWKDDKRHGRGIVTYAAPDGGVAERYEGEWRDGLISHILMHQSDFR